MFNDEVKKGIENGITKRLSSPFYGYFLISWSLVNWKFLYITLFISNESIVEETGKLKINYVSDLFFNKSIPELFFINITIPILSTIFIVWIFSIFTYWIYRKDLENEVEMKVFKLDEEKKMLDIEEKKVEKEEKVTEIQKRLTELKEKAEEEKNRPALWDEEYKKNRKQLIFTKILDSIISSIYDYGGLVEVEGPFPSSSPKFKIPPKILAQIDTDGLVTFSGKNIKLTDKGRFFIKKYQEERKKKIHLSEE